MNLRNFTQSLGFLAASVAAEGDQKEMPEKDRFTNTPEITASVIDTKGKIGNISQGEEIKMLLDKITSSVPNVNQMLQAKEPELYTLLLQEKPEILEMSLGDLLTPLKDILSILIDLLGAEGVIILAILMWIFGPMVVLKRGWWLGAKTVKLLTAEKEAEEAGKPLTKRTLPQINQILAELQNVSGNTMGDPSADSQRALEEQYQFLKERMDGVRFIDQDEGLGIFKLLMQIYYLDLRIQEIQRVLLNPATAQRQGLENELTNLTTLQGNLLIRIAENSFNIGSIRKGSEAKIAASLQRQIRRVMERLGRDEPSVRTAEGMTKELASIPRIYEIDTELRRIRVLEEKLRLWNGRYHDATLVADPGAGASIAEQQRYQAAQTFIVIYEELSTDLEEERSRLDLKGQLAKVIKSKLPNNPRPRAISKAAIAVGGGYLLLKGLTTLSGIMDPTEPPAIEKPSPVDVERQRDEENKQREKREKYKEAKKSIEEARKKKEPQSSTPEKSPEPSKEPKQEKQDDSPPPKDPETGQPEPSTEPSQENSSEWKEL